MADLLDGLARYLQLHDLATYDPDGTSGDLFLEGMPPAPDECVVLTLYGSSEEPDARLPDEWVNLQVRVRGTADPRVSRARAHQIYDRLHGERRTTFPDGTYLVLAVALQTPASLGVDANGRHEHTTNYRLDVASPTTHRPE